MGVVAPGEKKTLNQDDIVGRVIWVWIERSEVLFAAGRRYFFRLTKRWYHTALFSRDPVPKWPVCEDDHSPTSGPEVKNEWSYTPTSLICLYRGHRDDTTVMRRLTTGLTFWEIRRCANVIEYTYTNPETWHWLGLLMDESPFRHPFPEWGVFIHIDNLLWQVIFLHNKLI